MRLTVLGSGTGTPNPDRAATSILLDVAGYHLMLDCGPAALRNLTLAGVDHRSLDAVFISHFHLDHTLDLWAFFYAAAYPDFTRPRPVQIFAPRGFERLHQALLAAYGPELAPPAEAVQTVIVDPTRPWQGFEPPHLPHLAISTSPVAHRPESIAYRLETGGLSLVYAGDTGWSEELIGLAQGVDWLILEATRPDTDPAQGHLTPTQAGRLARRAGVKRLLLNHLSAKHGDSDPAQGAGEVFGGQVLAARDGLCLDLRTGEIVTRMPCGGNGTDSPGC